MNRSCRHNSTLDDKQNCQVVSLRCSGGSPCDHLLPLSHRHVASALFCLPLTPLLIVSSLFRPSISKNTFLVSQRGAHDGGSGEEVRQVRDGIGQVGGLQPDVVPVRQLHVLPLQRAHQRLQPLLPAPALSRRPLPPLPQMLPLDRPHGNLSY